MENHAHSSEQLPSAKWSLLSFPWLLVHQLPFWISLRPECPYCNGPSPLAGPPEFQIRLAVHTARAPLTPIFFLAIILLSFPIPLLLFPPALFHSMMLCLFHEGSALHSASVCCLLASISTASRPFSASSK